MARVCIEARAELWRNTLKRILTKPAFDQRIVGLLDGREITVAEFKKKAADFIGNAGMIWTPFGVKRRKAYAEKRANALAYGYAR